MRSPISQSLRYLVAVRADRHRGIFFVNTGNAGQNNHSDGRQTITEVLIDGEKVSYLVVQAPDGTNDFSVREQW